MNDLFDRYTQIAVDRRWRNVGTTLKSGGKIWLDPTLTLRHHDGMQVFAGDVGEWLKTHA